jgi:hypothetical protein
MAAPTDAMHVGRRIAAGRGAVEVRACRFER